MSDSDGWAFGSGGFAKLYGDRLAQSSLLDRDVATRWVFVFMLSQADAEGRYRCASVAGLARAAAVTLEQAEKAVRELEEPDPDSTTRDHDGRRLLRIPGGWQIVTFSKYREFRTPRQIADAERQRRHRARSRDTERDVTACHAPEGRRQKAEDRQRTNGAAVAAVDTVPATSPEREAERAEVAACESTCRELAALSGKPLDEILWEYSEFKGRRLVRLDTAPPRWLQVTHDRVRAALIEARREQARKAPSAAGPVLVGPRTA